MKIRNCFCKTQLRITRLRKYPIDPKAYLGRCTENKTYTIYVLKIHRAESTQAQLTQGRLDSGADLTSGRVDTLPFVFMLKSHFLFGPYQLFKKSKKKDSESSYKAMSECQKIPVRSTGKLTVTTYTCRYGPVSLDLSVVVSKTTGPRDSPHRRGSGSGTGSLETVSRGPVSGPVAP